MRGWQCFRLPRGTVKLGEGLLLALAFEQYPGNVDPSFCSERFIPCRPGIGDGLLINRNRCVRFPL